MKNWRRKVHLSLFLRSDSEGLIFATRNEAITALQASDGQSGASEVFEFREESTESTPLSRSSPQGYGATGTGDSEMIELVALDK